MTLAVSLTREGSRLHNPDGVERMVDTGDWVQLETERSLTCSLMQITPGAQWQNPTM